jgi:hypothetical protein
MNAFSPSEYKTKKYKKKSPSRIIILLTIYYIANRLRWASVEITKKPLVPTVKDKPIMGLKSDKNYITANAVDVILMGKINK